MSRWIAAVVAACMLFSMSPAFAQSIGIVRGRVTEANAPVAHAQLTLTGEGQRFTTTSGPNGSYSFVTVPFGHYTLTVHAAGAADRSYAVDVSSDSVVTVNADLLKTIVVTSTTASAGVGGTPVAVTTIDKQQIQTSPDRNSLNKLISTVPGAVQFSYNEPVINGFHGITYQIDGAPLPLATTSNFAEIVDPRDIDSLEIFSGAIPAEYGGDRMGAVVNIITDRFENLPKGTFGTISAGGGNQAQATGELDTVSRFGNNELFLAFNSSSSGRGLDAPTYKAIHDNSSSHDEFLRDIVKIDNQSTLALDYSNQFSQFQIPINTDPNNPNDPIVAIPRTDDTQLEYDRFVNLNFTRVSKDGNGVFQLIPWYRSTQVNYNGDLGADVQGFGPNFGCANFPDCASDTPPDPNTLNNVGLRQSTYANYLGVRISELRSGRYHTVKVGIDTNRENSTASQTYACFYLNCANPGGGVTPPAVSPYFAATSAQAQPGSQFAAYAEDQYQPTKLVSFNYGARFDHSTGYTSGSMVEPRIGVNVSDGGRNVVHLFYGRFYAAPLLEDVRAACSIFAAQGGCSTTAPAYDLKPEMDSYYEMGIQHSFGGGLTGYVNVFTKSSVNVLDTTQLLNTPLFAVYNNAIGRDNGLELRLQDRLRNGNSWFFTGTYSESLAGGISGSTFLFPPNANPPDVSITSAQLLSQEDHSEPLYSTAAYTARFGHTRDWFATLQGEYGSGFPVAFQDANVNLSGRLPAHTTFDLALGREILPGRGPESRGLGVSLDVDNLLNHQYVIKIANGFNTTQIANGRSFMLRLTEAF
jgi:outer membrane receptor protein involved in Fe transport